MAITKEFLEGLGLEKETAEKIFAERGKEIDAEKKKLEESEKKLSDANGKLKSLEDEVTELKKVDADGLNKKIEALEKQISDRKAEDEKQAKEQESLTRFESVIGEGKFVNELTKKGIFEEFKDAIEKEENKGKGDSDIYSALTKDREGIFASENPGIDIPGMGSGGEGVTDENAARAVMGLPPIQK